MVVTNIAGINLRLAKIFLCLCMVGKIDFNWVDCGYSEVDPNLITLLIMAYLHQLIATISINQEVVSHVFSFKEIDGDTSQPVTAVCSHLSVGVKHRHLVSALNLAHHQDSISSY